jgi:hypothetical protein
LHNTNVFNEYELAPTYNAAPQTVQPVIRLNSEISEREIVVMKWGLLPSWSKTIKLKYSTINATADKLTTSSVWKEPFQHRAAVWCPRIGSTNGPLRTKPVRLRRPMGPMEGQRNRRGPRILRDRNR